MPKVEVSRKDLLGLAGLDAGLSDSDLEERLAYLKAELDAAEGDVLKIELNDTNRPDLWCVEGIARGLRCLDRGGETHLSGMPEPGVEVHVDGGLAGIRPFIAAFTASGWAPGAEGLEALIATQEKLAASFGRQRKTAATGFYRLEGISFPVAYRASDPGTEFVPLGYETGMTMSGILADTETGRKYAHLLDGFDRYPLLADSAGEVLSFPPVLNSRSTGCLGEGDSEIFCEVTGTDWNTVQLTATILACNLEDRGAAISPVRVVYPPEIRAGGGVTVTPVVYADAMEVWKSEIGRVLGRYPGDQAVRRSLDLMDYAGCRVDEGTVKGVMPPYRHDGIHGRDMIEDIAIGSGLDGMEPLLPEEFTVGRPAAVEELGDQVRLILTGAGCEEIMRPVLGSMERITGRSATPDVPVAIGNPMTAEYEVVRNTLLPGLLEVEGSSAHAVYPHRLFEVGEVLLRDEAGTCRTEVLLSVLVCSNDADFGDAHSVLGALCHSRELDLGLAPVDDPRFIPGRAAEVRIGGGACGILGEVHPSVLESWGIGRPAAGFEIRLDSLRG
jgi:phenylalanyl-tRNA synthetase beta chain